jgi:hypothetical protein
LLKTIPSFGSVPVQPQLEITNASLCLPQDNRWIHVETVNISDEQHICADLKSDIYPVRITLLIYKENALSPVYSTASQFGVNLVSFQIFLPAGRYRAKIMYARSVLAEFRFEVTK